MRIVQLHLRGFRRLSLNHINEIIYTPTTIAQMILGTNASGKSSIMKELGPLPPNKDEYTHDGFKIFTAIASDGHTYILKTTFSPSTRHSMIRIMDHTQVELNPSGTAAIQRTLIYQVFKITPAIHELLTGTINFHSMSTAERRTWFTLLTDKDYTYVTGVYRKLKDTHRDIQGGIKLMSSRLVAEEAKLLTPMQHMRLKESVLDLNNLVDYLVSLKPATQSHVIDLNKKYTDNATVLDRIARD